MEIRYKRRPRLQAVAAQFLLGIAGLALITFVCFQVGLGPGRTGLAYVVLLALISLLGSFSSSVVLSVLAAACLNYFFAPPLFELRVDTADDIVRIAAFLTTSLVVTALIATRKRVEEELAESNARLEEAQRLAHVGWWQRDFTTGRVSLSDEVCRIFGVQPLELPQWHERWLQLIHPDDRPRAAEAAEAALRRGGPRYDVEYRVVRPDGGERIVRSQGDVTRDESGKPVRQFGVLQDVTELRQAEEELRASEARFRTFVDFAADAFMLHRGEDGTVLDVNQQACDSLGYAREELIGMAISDFDAGVSQDAAFLEGFRKRLETGEAFSFETSHRRKDGTVFPVEVRARSLWHGDRRLRVSFARDITERKRAEAEARESERRYREVQMALAHANRVATMGQLTASIAHEVNQPIGAARNHAASGLRYLLRNPPSLDDLRKALERVVNNTDRAGEIIARIRAHIKKVPPRDDRLDINEAIREAIEFTRSEAVKNSVSLKLQLTEGLLLIQGDRIQLQQVVLNLILNAMEAMSSVDESTRELSISTERRGANEILVAVRDSGPGIDPEHLERVFDSFYTTKPSGMGLGLSICRSIVDAHGGRLWADVNEPRGAVFQFTWPTGHQDS